MTRLMKSIASLTRGFLKCGIKVSFTEAELKEMGIKVPKSKLHLVKPEIPQEMLRACTFRLPVRTIDLLKRKAVAAHKPYNVFVNEVLARAAL